MDKKFQIDNRGFSLIELLVCLAISAFVIVSALSLIMVGTKNYDRANKATSLQQEMAFITNLVGQSIREGNQAESSITKYSAGTSSDGLVICTGKKAIVYVKDKNSLYVYNRTDDRPPNSYYSLSDPNLNDHLVSKYVESFEAEYVAEKDGVTMPVYDSGTTVGGANAIAKSRDTDSSLIKITISVKVKDKSDSTEVIYQIRN